MFSTHERITIGRNVDIGMRCTFITATHEVGGPSRRAGALRTAGIRIGDGAWIGAGVTVLPGVDIGDGCVVAAGAVVTKNCESGGTYAGIPARRIR
ncbi:hypothetical protein B5M43_014515 [Microbacterium sp. MEC084]|uniref:acyltransferase n=1 Tax=Microbacterium sp. MEC084 TaxID=1963027 RepID=UPI001E288E02|nr:acyltransferase [Microbacterium sp. MEC084]MCD1270024.1 hypothetical protein [Microbacterium sp. MEC084]